MLDMGFVDDITEILENLYHERQSLFFTATLERKIESLVRSFTTDPVMIEAKTGDTAELVDQDVVQHSGHASDKLSKLHDILLMPEVEKTLIFESTQISVERLADSLEDKGFVVEYLHGGKSQSQRTRSLDRFKKSAAKIMVATDVAARGIDIADITHVINYSLPMNYEDYTHRIGRAGRAGRKGWALTFVEEERRRDSDRGGDRGGYRR
jgi:ATP-dependent RNA helicase RhlE